MTKPVEKPIPKPLPPTVGSETSTTTTTTTTSAPAQTSSTATSTTTTIAPSSSPTSTSSPSETSPTPEPVPITPSVSPNKTKPSSAPYASRHSSSPQPFKRFKPYHNQYSPSNNPPRTPYYQQTQTSPYNQFNQHPTIAYSQSPPIQYAVAAPGQPIYTYQYPNQVQPQLYAYQANQSYYANGSYYTAPNAAYSPYAPIVKPVQYFNYQQSPYVNGTVTYQPQYQYPQQQQPQQTQQPQQQQVYQEASNQQFNNSVKIEPDESGLKVNEKMNSVPYFTNPVPFKQEPSENNVVTTGSDESTKMSDEDSNAFSIVTHLLKDKQILNQLEKVAQSFKQPTNGSLFQGSWNFSSSST